MLLELLWLREAHALSPTGVDLPPPLMATPASAVNTVDDATRSQWEADWGDVWERAASHAGLESDRRLFDRLRSTADGSPERESLLHAMVGPSWGDQHGRKVFDDQSYRSWERDGMDALLASRQQPASLENEPERRDLDVLIPAWRAGLTKIVVIPCQGEHTRKLGSNALLVTDATRAESSRYRRALSAFA